VDSSFYRLVAIANLLSGHDPTLRVRLTTGEGFTNAFLYALACSDTEPFNSRFRDEFLEAEEFESVPDARRKAQWFRREYNIARPHSSLAYKTPQEFSDECDGGLHSKTPEKELLIRSIV